MANTAWSTTDHTSGVTLSGSNLIATNSTAAVRGGRAADKQTTGKYYWEITTSTFANANSAVGLAGGLADMTSGTSARSAFLVVRGSANMTLDGNSLGVSLGTVTTGSLLCFAVDFGARLLWVRLGAAGNWNGNASFGPTAGGGFDLSPIAGAGEPLYPAYMFGAAANEQVTANFGGSAFTGTVPTGYTSGFTSGATAALTAISAGVIRETLLATDGTLEISGLIREVLRSTSTGAGTYAAIDGLVREVLRTQSKAASGGPMISVIM